MRMRPDQIELPPALCFVRQVQIPGIHGAGISEQWFSPRKGYGCGDIGIRPNELSGGFLSVVSQEPIEYQRGVLAVREAHGRSARVEFSQVFGRWGGEGCQEFWTSDFAVGDGGGYCEDAGGEWEGEAGTGDSVESWRVGTRDWS